MSDRGGKSTVQSAILEWMRKFRASDQGAEVQFSRQFSNGSSSSAGLIRGAEVGLHRLSPTAGKVIDLQGVSGPKWLQLQGK